MTDRSRGALVGLMVGEAFAWPSLYERSYLLPFWTRRKRREIDASDEGSDLLGPSLPFALNQPTTAFTTAPGPRSEWVAFQLALLADSHGSYDPARARDAWQELASNRAALRVTVGQHGTLTNLIRGKDPPQSGHDHPHYFDDGACFRALPLVLVTGDAWHAAVSSDARISNGQDGVWAALAYGAALKAAVGDGTVEDVVRSARAELPADSWIGTEVARALDAAAATTDSFELITILADEHTNHAYNYGNAAPETVALCLAILQHADGDLRTALLVALALPKTAGSVAPLVASLCGALGAALPAAFEGRAVRGIGLPSVAGLEPMALLTQALQQTS